MSDETQINRLAHSLKLHQIELEDAVDKVIPNLHEELRVAETDLAKVRAERDEALSILRELVAGADDYRCWWVPMIDEIRALVERAGPAGAHPAGTGKENRDG